jgi:hypothetical protein
VSLQTKLLFKKGDNHILPGEVMRIQAEDKVVMDFYITEVVHVIDVAGGTARTEITGAYPRPEDGFPGIVEIGTCNPVWE